MQRNFFEIDDCYSRLDKAGDPLTKLDSMINWAELDKQLEPIRFESGESGGRPGLKPLVVVKFMLLQSLYNLSDEACEYQVNDRLSFKRFLGLGPSEKSPDAKTIWLYRERMKYKGLHDMIFEWFGEQMDKAGFRAEAGQIIDASFVPTHKPTGQHKKQLAEEVPLTAAQARQIDPDATFTKKGGQRYHGYKNHIQIDNKYKIIRKYAVTTASLHDSQEFAHLLDSDENQDKEVWADSAYRSEEIENLIIQEQRESHIHERAYRNKPLTAEQKASNKLKSRFRARVEHVFGHMTTSMSGLTTHVIGIARTRVKIVLKNLAYNMQRFVFLMSSKKTKPLT